MCENNTNGQLPFFYQFVNSSSNFIEFLKYILLTVLERQPLSQLY